jgi:hypothetical protein
VDPIIQFPTNSQSLNPYSYIMNNPLAGTDPTGYAACLGTPEEGKSCTETVKPLGSNISKSYTVVGGATTVSVYATGGNGATSGSSPTGASGQAGGQQNIGRQANAPSVAARSATAAAAGAKTLGEVVVTARRSTLSRLARNPRALLLFLFVGDNNGLREFVNGRPAGCYGACTCPGVSINVCSTSGENETSGIREETPPPPATDADGEEGCIYCVKGENTSSGKDYVGSTDDLGQRQRDRSDGRDCEGAEIIDRYPKGDRGTRRAKEQQAINDRGGVEKLDNKRNEVAPRRWPEYGVTPPQ